MQVSQVKNPCVGICSATSLGDEYCIGCGRYWKDVIEWNAMTQAQKQEALDRAREVKK